MINEDWDREDWDEEYQDTSESDHKKQALDLFYSAEELCKHVKVTIEEGPFRFGDATVSMRADAVLVLLENEREVMSKSEFGASKYTPSFRLFTNYNVFMKAFGHECAVKFSVTEIFFIDRYDLRTPGDALKQNVLEIIEETTDVINDNLQKFCKNIINKKSGVTVLELSFDRPLLDPNKAFLGISTREHNSAWLARGALRLLEVADKDKDALRSLMIMYASGEVDGIALERLTGKARANIVKNTRSNELREFAENPLGVDVIELLDDDDVRERLQDIMTGRARSRANRVMRRL